MLCELDDIAKQKFGADIAKQFQSRLADIISFANIHELYELSVGNPREITFGSTHATQLSFGTNNTLIFICNHVKKNIQSDKTDWSKVNRIQIVDIK